MKLLNEYLQQVKFWLPKSIQEDVIAELTEEIQTEINAKEESTGTSLTQIELEEILQRWGNPVSVAQQYMPKQWLIGPSVFPIYQFTVKMMWCWWLIPWLVVWLGMEVFSPAYRASHPVIQGLGAFLQQVVWCMILVIGSFAVYDRWLSRTGGFDNWRPRSLTTRRKTGFEWKSRASILGLPLIHIAVGRDSKGKMHVARGLIAIGQFGVGLVTIAQVGVGFGFGLGQIILAPIAIGQLAFGIFAVGIVAGGLKALSILKIGSILAGKG